MKKQSLLRLILTSHSLEPIRDLGPLGWSRKKEKEVPYVESGGSSCSEEDADHSSGVSRHSLGAKWQSPWAVQSMNGARGKQNPSLPQVPV